MSSGNAASDAWGIRTTRTVLRAPCVPVFFMALGVDMLEKLGRLYSGQKIKT